MHNCAFHSENEEIEVCAARSETQPRNSCVVMITRLAEQQRRRDRPLL